MAGTDHNNLVEPAAVHPAAYVASSDPGSVGPHKFWVDTSTAAPYQLKKRNAANTTWENVGSQASLTDPTTTRGDLIARGVSAIARLAVGANSTLLASNGTDPAWSAGPTLSGELTALDLKVTGMTGVANTARLVGGTASGAPVSGTFAVRDYVVTADGTIWICTAAGSPGTWAQVAGAGVGGGGTTVSTSSDAFKQTKITDTTNKTTTSTTLVIIDNTYLPALSMNLSAGDVVRCTLMGQISGSTGALAALFDTQVVQPTSGTVRANATAGVGTAEWTVGTSRWGVNAVQTFTATEAGAHTFQPMWATTTGTLTIYNGTSGDDDSAILYVIEKLGAAIPVPYVNMQDQKTSGSQGGGFTSGAWRTRDLNTEVDDSHSIASLSANQITLPAGTYRTAFAAVAHQCNRHQTRLQNVTDATTLATGLVNFAGTTGTQENYSMGTGKFTLSASKTLELQHQCQTTRATDGFGTPNSFGTEVFSMIEFWKEA